MGGEGGTGLGVLVVAIKEVTYCMEHWVWGINESWNNEKIKLNLKKIEGEMKSFQDKQNLKEFANTKPALQEILKGVL